MIKNYLLTPGPTPVPERILANFAKPIVHHRTPQFKAILEEVQKGLQYLYQTKQDVLLLSASGTGAMDATVTNLFSPGDTVIVLNAGKFGGRWTKISRTYGLNCIEVKVPPGASVSASQVEQALHTNPQAKAVLFQASETSTGVSLPTQEICTLVKKFPHCLSIVDAITALGVMPLPMDDWGIDVLITGSQKALMLPPGLSCIALSDKAWRHSLESKIPKFYFDLAKERDSQRKGQTAWTPPVSLIDGLREALHMIQSETLPEVFLRHDRCARATRAAVKALGLELFAEQMPSPAVTAVKVPTSIKDGKLIPKFMREVQGVSIAGGQDELEGKIFRLTHLGYIDQFDIIIGISALEMTLHSLGYKNFSLGAGVGAAMATFMNESQGRN